MEQDQIFLPFLPIPPSSNHQYKSFLDKRTGKVRHVSSAALTEYKREIRLLTYVHRFYLADARKWVAEKLKQKYVFNVEATFFFKRSEVYTKKGEVKKMDVSNRIKALHDCVCGDLLEMDDRYIFTFRALKSFCTEEIGSSVALRIDAYQACELGTVRHNDMQ